MQSFPPSFCIPDKQNDTDSPSSLGPFLSNSHLHFHVHSSKININAHKHMSFWEHRHPGIYLFIISLHFNAQGFLSSFVLSFQILKIKLKNIP